MGFWDNDGDQPDFEGQMPPNMRIISMARAMDEQHMAAQEMRASIERLFEELSGDQTWTLMRMLAYVSGADKLGHLTANFWAGQLSMYLKFKHQICSNCGNPSHDGPEHFLHDTDGGGETFLIQRGGTGAPMQREPADDEKVQGEEVLYTLLNDPDLKRWCEIEAMNNEVTPAKVLAKLKQYGVFPTQYHGENLGSEVICARCSAKFLSLSHRMKNGQDCPSCDAMGKLGSDG